MKTLLFTILSVPVLTFAQNYDAKKGKVNLDKNLIATYDGKGGLLKMFDLTVSSPGAKPLFSIKEKYYDPKNPMRRDGVRWAEVVFLDNPEKKMNFRFPNDLRVLERDLISLFFKDSTPSLVQGEALNAEVVDAFIKKNHFDYVADSLYIRKYEQDNKMRIMEPLSRDKTKAIKLKQSDKTSSIKNGGTRYITTFEIWQDDVLIGQVQKELFTSAGFSSKAFYTIWKRTLSPYTFEDKEYKHGMLAYVSTDSPTFDQELVLMTDKSRLKYKTNDHTSAEYQIVNLLISNGVL